MNEATVLTSSLISSGATSAASCTFAFASSRALFAASMSCVPRSCREFPAVSTSEALSQNTSASSSPPQATKPSASAPTTKGTAMIFFNVNSRFAERGRRKSSRWRRRQGRLGRKQRKQRTQLQLGLGQLRLGVGVSDYAVAGEHVRGPVAEERGADPDAELTVLRRIHPSERPGVPASVELFEAGDRRVRRVARLPADGGCRVKEACQLDGRPGLRQLGADRGAQVLDVGDLH